ncbi:MAG: FAD-binding protein [Anaerolineales bacterium]|nr:FAD-binding protein [Anaerolineales bacterium]
MSLTSIAQVQEAVRAAQRVVVRGAGTKPALLPTVPDATIIEVSGLSGLLEYEPAEFTFTALAGTPLAVVQAALDEHGQYLPFDPLLVERGATLGGALASGLSGPGRYRFGGLRDFILGIRYVDGAGELVRGGGKVVKNAAGFDLPKLMVGSLGQFGVLVELTFKVFPRPRAYLTLRADYPSLKAALAALHRLYNAPLDVDALDLWPSADGGASVLARLGGAASALPKRAERVQAVLQAGAETPDEAQLWRVLRELSWVPVGWGLVKVPLAPGRLAALAAALPSYSQARYSAGGNVAWVVLPNPAGLAPTLTRLDLAGLIVQGRPGSSPRLGVHPGAPFEQRLKTALDPLGKFPTIPVLGQPRLAP